MPVCFVLTDEDDMMWVTETGVEVSLVIVMTVYITKYAVCWHRGAACEQHSAGDWMSRHQSLWSKALTEMTSLTIVCWGTGARDADVHTRSEACEVEVDWQPAASEGLLTSDELCRQWITLWSRRCAVCCAINTSTTYLTAISTITTITSTHATTTDSCWLV